MAMQDNININQVDYEKRRHKSAKVLVWACFFLYVLMMGSKNVFTAELVTLQGVFGTTKAETSLAMTYYFITYAIGQLVLSVLFGKINLRIFLFVTGSLSAIVTIALGLSSSIVLAYVLCGVNGVFQAGIYSGCMGILSKHLPLKLLPYAKSRYADGNSRVGRYIVRGFRIVRWVRALERAVYYFRRIVFTVCNFLSFCRA